MRIISGDYRGRNIRAPKNLPTRPTTDFAKEALFNVLVHEYNFEQLEFLDLFSGTGNISYEMASRGCRSITCIEQNPRCVRFIRDTFKMLDHPSKVIQADVFRFLKKPSGGYDLIFADPPYHLEKIADLPELVMQSGMLKPEGLFILEHGGRDNFEEHPNHREDRVYGQVNFAFFEYI